MSKKLSLAVLCLGLLVLAGVSLNSTAHAQDFERGLQAHDRGDYATALREWLPLAEQGDSSAQYNLGLMYYRGEGVRQNHGTAVKWWRRSAVQGNTHAQNNLGSMYRHGRGVAQNDTEAIAWWRRAAKQGNADAQQNLGVAYGSGGGVIQNVQTAYVWLTIANINGSKKAKQGLDIVERYLSPGEISNARRLAAQCRHSNYTDCPGLR